MIKKEIIKRWHEMTKGHERALYQEYVIFCNYAMDKQFDNFRKDELRYKEFTELADFLCKNRCFLLLSRLLRCHRNRYIRNDIKIIKKIKLRKDIEKRFKKFVM